MGTRSHTLFGWVTLALALVPGMLACGAGGAAEAAPVASPHENRTSSPESADSDEGPAEEESAPARGTCDDGSCSPCGDGMCPTGWYCDDSASGGPACSWVPQCAQKSSCGCLTAALGSACKCAEQGGGLHVTCK